MRPIPNDLIPVEWLRAIQPGIYGDQMPIKSGGLFASHIGRAECVQLCAQTLMPPNISWINIYNCLGDNGR